MTKPHKLALIDFFVSWTVLVSVDVRSYFYLTALADQ